MDIVTRLISSSCNLVCMGEELLSGSAATFVGLRRIYFHLEYGLQ